MTTTRANVEQILIARVGAWLTNAGLDGTTINGTNAALNDPIGYAIVVAGGSVASRALVIDADVQTVSDSNFDKMLAVAELRALENTLSNFTGVDKKAGPVEIKSSQFADRLLILIARKRAQLLADYNIGGGTVLSFVPATYGVDTTDEFARPPDYWP